MAVNIKLDQELVKKYQWAAKIRLISFTLLFLFLLAMKSIGGYSYLNSAIVSLVFIEAILNRPWGFLIRRVNLYRFQFYQMTTDIVCISWVLYYMGGIEAPLINIGYYIIILWAGVVSDELAVFFAVVLSSLLFSSIVILSHFGALPHISFFDYHVPTAQMFSVLLGNISFLFAFGYFSARSVALTKLLERKKQEETLRHTHKFLAAGYLVSSIAHDVINYLITIRAYVQLLLDRANTKNADSIKFSNEEGLKHIEEAERKSAELLAKLLQFSQRPEERFSLVDLHKVINDVLGLTLPLLKMSDVVVNAEFAQNLPLVFADKDQIQEVFVVLVLNALDAMQKKGNIKIRTSHLLESNSVEIMISDTGVGIKQKLVDKVGTPFFTTKTTEKNLGLGLTIAYEIIARHSGKVWFESFSGKGTTFFILLPACSADRPAIGKGAHGE